jgi:uncharacterized Zn-binding protein involved in type VI secretion
MMSMSSFERPLEADPMIMMSSSLGEVPVLNGSIRTWTPSTFARAVPNTRLDGSCLPTLQGALLTHISSCPSRYVL